MSSYSSSLTFRPGSSNRESQRKIMNRYNRELLRLQSNLVTGGENSDYFCECFADKVDRAKQGYRDSQATTAQRISTLVNLPLGGRTQFGQGYVEPIVLPLRNKF